MLFRCFVGLALLCAIQTFPVPDATTSTSSREVTNTYTTSDGTVVKEVIIKRDGHKVKKIVIKKVKHSESTTIDSEIHTMSDTTVTTNANGVKIVKIPAYQLYTYLISKGFAFPQDITQVPVFGENPTRIITIYLAQLYKAIANVDQLGSASPIKVLKFLKTSTSTIISAESNVAVTTPAPVQTSRCKNGLVKQAAGAVTSTVHEVLSNVASVFGSNNAVGDVVHGASALVTHAVSGVNVAVQDVACGLENVVDTAASALDTGNVVDIVKGAGDIVGEAVSTVGSAVTGAVSEVASGLDDAAHDIFGALTDLL